MACTSLQGGTGLALRLPPPAAPAAHPAHPLPGAPARAPRLAAQMTCRRSFRSHSMPTCLSPPRGSSRGGRGSGMQRRRGRPPARRPRRRRRRPRWRDRLGAPSGRAAGSDHPCSTLRDCNSSSLQQIQGPACISRVSRLQGAGRRPRPANPSFALPKSNHAAHSHTQQLPAGADSGAVQPPAGAAPAVSPRFRRRSRPACKRCRGWPAAAQGAAGTAQPGRGAGGWRRAPVARPPARRCAGLDHPAAAARAPAGRPTASACGATRMTRLYQS